MTLPKPQQTNCARPPILGPSGNQDQTDTNAAARCKKFLALISALVLIFFLKINHSKIFEIH